MFALLAPEVLPVIVGHCRLALQTVPFTAATSLGVEAVTAFFGGCVRSVTWLALLWLPFSLRIAAFQVLLFAPGALALNSPSAKLLCLFAPEAGIDPEMEFVCRDFEIW